MFERIYFNLFLEIVIDFEEFLCYNENRLGRRKIMANGRLWTDEEIKILEDCYDKAIPIKDIAKKLNRTKSGVEHKIKKLNLTSETGYKTSSSFKAIYQDRDWLISEILQNKNYKEIAKDANAKPRVIQKWMNDKYHLSFKDLYKLNDLQRKLIIWGTLGDGHIDKRKEQPMYIESHAIDEKDYLFWKYDKLKDMFNNEPVYYQGQIATFLDGKEYQCQPFYRVNNKIIDDLKPIRDMSVTEKIKTLDDFSLCLYLLDDASRSESSWDLCVAMLTSDEKDLFCSLVKERLGLNCNIRNYDNRYIRFNAESSRKIDEMMLQFFGKDMDIIKKKILKNRKDLG